MTSSISQHRYNTRLSSHALNSENASNDKEAGKRKPDASNDAPPTKRPKPGGPNSLQNQFIRQVRPSSGEEAGHRIEQDALGSIKVPGAALYGSNTARALNNFPNLGTPGSRFPEMIRAIARIKQATALANHELGKLDEHKKNAIVHACQELIKGEHHDQFVVETVQGGAGTSFNMNANEVIANIGLKFMGHKYGEYNHLHPNNDVNMSQSTNDAYPTTLKLAFHEKAHATLQAMEEVKNALRDKASEFQGIVKVGRTEMNDAAPMTLGSEFKAWKDQLKNAMKHVEQATQELLEMNLGATAIGTGITAPEGFAKTVCKHLREITGLEVKTAKNLIAATSDVSPFVRLSEELKIMANTAKTICADLMLLSSGPLTGLKEVKLPPLQPGSSIMPGKVNPVALENFMQYAMMVEGHAHTVSLAGAHKQLQLNAFEPLIAKCLLESLDMLRKGGSALAQTCIKGITANEAVLQSNVEKSASIVTGLKDTIGYDNASRVAKAVVATGGEKTVRQVVLEMQAEQPLTKDGRLLSEKDLDTLLDPMSLTMPDRTIQ